MPKFTEEEMNNSTMTLECNERTHLASWIKREDANRKEEEEEEEEATDTHTHTGMLDTDKQSRTLSRHLNSSIG